MINQSTSPQRLPSSAESFIASLEESEPPHLSIVLDTPGGGKEWQQHRKRLEGRLESLVKNTDLVSRYGRQAVSDLLARTRSLVNLTSSWAGEYGSVGILVSEDVDRLLTNSTPVREFEHVGNEFVLKQLAPALSSEYDGLVLHFSLKSPEFFRVRGKSIKRLAASELPSSIFELSEAEVVDEGRRAHSRGSLSGEGPAIVPHGVAGNDSVIERNMPSFVRDVKRVVTDLNGERALPLVVIAKDKIASSFEEAYANDAGALFVDTTAKSPLEESEILKICANWQKEQYNRHVKEILDTLSSADNRSSQYSDNLHDLYEGSRRGRVGLCAVSLESDLWCRYEEKSGKLESVPENQRMSDSQAFEVTDRIFKSVIRTGGECVVVPGDNLPSKKPVVGLFKW